MTNRIQVRRTCCICPPRSRNGGARRSCAPGTETIPGNATGLDKCADGGFC
jgi:hypothetical protein